MTVDEILTLPTESLVLPSPRICYPSNIPPGHWQLRSLISLPQSDIVYYASESEIWCLRTDDLTRELISLLPWRPLCLSAGYGWVCVGGQKGLLAAVKLSGYGSASQGQGTSRRGDDIDAPLPLDLDPGTRGQTRGFYSEGLASDRPIFNPKHERHVYELGDDVVNSITLHRWPKEAGGCHEETVAVIASNDKTVRIFSLSQSRLLTTLSFPFPMNQAQISPNGKLLVAVGDAPIAFFYSIALSSHNGSAVYEWSLCSESKLEPAFDSRCREFGYFPTAFSPSGHLCAVGSQDGVIIILDTSLIRDPQVEDDQIENEDPIIAVIESSRPRTAPGAIRSLYFSPQPLDLLIWTEDQGRVCVVDIRERFRSRQVIHLDTKADGVKRVSITELPTTGQDPDLRELRGEAELITQYHRAIDVQDDVAALNLAAEWVQGSTERRRLQRRAHEQHLSGEHEDGDDDLRGLTEREQQILDALRTSRDGNDARQRTEAHGQQSPISVNYLAPSMNSGEARTPPHLALSDEILRIYSSTGRDTNTTPSLRDYIHQRNLERTRVAGRGNWPRSRSSIMAPNDNASQAALTPPTTEPATSALRTSPQSIRTADHPAINTDPWRTIEAAMLPNPLPDAASRLRREREQAIEASSERRQERETTMETARRETLRSVYTRRAYAAEREGLSRLGTLRRVGAIGSDWGVGTTGLGMSPNGRKLYVGTEEGIIEYQINIQERKSFPKVDPL
ncbi:MAG: hypothetical protein M1812_003044 [Candelaria pacifica]|nr:MAG: hypothetical protein M1812_003044 [Candelaria pacifica]